MTNFRRHSRFLTVLIFLGFRPTQATEPVPKPSKKRDATEEEDDGIVDLLDMEIGDDDEENIKKTLEEKTKYKEVAPTWELNIETYGYGKRRKVYDPGKKPYLIRPCI